MMKIALISIFSLFIQSISSQSIYEEFNHKNFRKSKELLQEIDPNNFKPELLNAAVFFATNEIRAKKKLSILEYNPLLGKAATIHSNDMAKGDFFGHTNHKNKKHREPEDRARVAGISNPKIAENVIEGFILEYQANQSVVPIERGVFLHKETREQLQNRTYLELTDQLIEDWMNSKGHRANILSDKALELGCGSALYYMSNFNDMPAIKATQNFQWFFKATKN